MRIQESFPPWIRDGKNSDPESGINIADPQHCYYDRMEYPEMIYGMFPPESALLTVESGVVARVLEPGSGEASEQQTQVNHNKGSLAGFELDLWETLNVCRKKKIQT
jgi:hypothetical protein